MNIVDKLVEYYKNRDAAVLGSLPMIEAENLIVIVIELLSWLKLERKREMWQEQGKKVKNKPMNLNLDYPWSNDLIKILELDNPFAEVFYIKNNTLAFKDNISDDYIREARLLAYEKYNPQKVVG